MITNMYRCYVLASITVVATTTVKTKHVRNQKIEQKQTRLAKGYI